MRLDMLPRFPLSWPPRDEMREHARALLRAAREEAARATRAGKREGNGSTPSSRRSPTGPAACTANRPSRAASPQPLTRSVPAITAAARVRLTLRRIVDAIPTFVGALGTHARARNTVSKKRQQLWDERIGSAASRRASGGSSPSVTLSLREPRLRADLASRPRHRDPLGGQDRQKRPGAGGCARNQACTPMASACVRCAVPGLIPACDRIRTYCEIKLLHTRAQHGVPEVSRFAHGWLGEKAR